MTRSDWLGVAVEALAVAAGLVLRGWVGALAGLFVGAFALLMWRRIAPANRGLTWLDIEIRMKELRAKDIARIATRGDGPMDAAQVRKADGTHQWIFLGSNEQLRAEATRLFIVAGRKLRRSGVSVLPRVVAAGNDFDRWLWFLVEVGNHRKRISTTSYTPTTGRIETHTYWLEQVLDESVSACLECLKREGGE